MTTQYTSILKLALPVQGELSGTWGDVVNDNITSMVEEAIAGRAVINTWTTNSHTLTSANGTTSESRCAMLEFTDTGTALSGDATVICPTAAKIYICKNDAGQKVTIKTSAGTGVAIADGQTMFVFCDGTNVVEAVTSMSSLKLGTAVTSIEVTSILDEDDLVSDSATALATQQSIKAYVDSQVTAQDLDFAGDTGTGAVDLDSQSLTIAGTSNEIETSAVDQTLTIGLPDAVTVTTSVTTPTVQVTDVKANDGTAAVSIADTTGQTTITDAVLTTADINAGTIDNTTIGATTASTGAFTTITSSGNTTVSGQLVTDTISEETATAGVTVDGVLLKDGEVNTDTINEETAAAGVTVDGVLLKDGGATLTGDLTVDTDTLYVDSANDRVGINTASPGAPLEVDGGSDIAFFDGTNVRLKIQNPATGDLQLNSSGANDSLTFATVDTEAMRITSDQRVLIGATNSKAIGSSAAAGLQVAATGANSWISQIRYNNATSGPLLVIAKTRSATVGTVGTIVQDDDTLATLAFAGDDGVDVQTQAARIQANVDGTPGANDMPGRLTFWTTADGASSVTERMRISQDGNVGIGITDTDYARLSVKGTFASAESTGFDSQVMYLTNDSASKLSGMTMIAASDNGTIAQVGRIGTYNVHPATGYLGEMTFSTRDGSSMVEALRIDQNQRVLIGLTSSDNVASVTEADLQIETTGIGAAIVSNAGASGPAGVLALGHKRGAGGVVSDGDALGDIRFAGHDGTDLESQAGQIRVAVDGTPGSNDMPGRLQFYTTADGAATVTERMRITSTGNVGIGETAPDTTLHVKGADNSIITIESEGAYDARLRILTPNDRISYIEFADTDDVDAGEIRYDHTNDRMQFRTGSNALVMTMDSSQQVVLGASSVRTTYSANTSSSGAKLAVEGTNADNTKISTVRNVNGVNGPYVVIGHSRGTAANGVTIVANDDHMGTVSFQGADGYVLQEGATIRAEVDGTPGVADMPGRLIFSTTSDGSSVPDERMRVTNDGTVLIGKTSATVASQGFEFRSASNNGWAGFTNDGERVAFFNRMSSNGDIVEFRKDNSEVGVISTSGSHLIIGSGDVGLNFNAANNQVRPWDTNTNSLNDAAVGLGSAGGRFTNLYLSDGIVFDDSGGSGTVTSRTFDDYEEGNWTPDVTFGGANTGITYSNVEGRYTKVGRLVTVFGRIGLSNNGSATGNMAIAGLPFEVGNVMNTTSVQGSTAFGYIEGTAGTQYGFIIMGWEQTSEIRVFRVNNTNGDSQSDATNSNILSSFDCRFTCTYMTA